MSRVMTAVSRSDEPERQEMTFSALSDVGYWTLKVWRDMAEDDMAQDTYWARQRFAELNAEIARRCEQMHGQPPPDGFDVEYSPMWLDGCNNHCIYHARQHPWVETAYEKASREGFERWDRREIERTRRRLEQCRGVFHERDFPMLAEQCLR